MNWFWMQHLKAKNTITISFVSINRIGGFLVARIKYHFNKQFCRTWTRKSARESNEMNRRLVVYHVTCLWNVKGNVIRSIASILRQAKINNDSLAIGTALCDFIIKYFYDVDSTCIYYSMLCNSRTLFGFIFLFYLFPWSNWAFFGAQNFPRYYRVSVIIIYANVPISLLFRPVADAYFISHLTQFYRLNNRWFSKFSNTTERWLACDFFELELVSR